MLVLRNVAMFASAGYIKSNDFHNAWPVAGEERETVLLTEDMKRNILSIHNAK